MTLRPPLEDLVDLRELWTDGANRVLDGFQCVCVEQGFGVREFLPQMAEVRPRRLLGCMTQKAHRFSARVP